MIKNLPNIQRGDTIAIISTARKVTSEEINYGIKWLESNGFKVVLGKTIGMASNQFAGNDNQRAEDLQLMIDNPKIKAIWCARGGYGTVRIIDKVDFSSFIKNPKWIIGYSDVTVLHSHLHNLNIPTIHAPLAFDIEKATIKAKDSLFNIFLKQDYTYEFETDRDNKLGEASGVAVGGNLSILYSLCGSKSSINTHGKILFLEDLDEYLYHIDRMLQNLDRNGFFKNLKGLVIGSMSNMHDHKIPFGFTVKEQILAITGKYNYPIIFKAPFGHISDNRPVIFGKKVKIHASKDKTILQAFS